MDSFMKYIARINRCSNCYRDQALEDVGLTGCQCPYLLRICHNPGISQDQLAKTLYVSKSNVTRQLERMEKAELITRAPSPSDRRVMQVFPTELGKSLLPRIGEMFSDWNSILTSDFTEEEKGQLISMLERLYANAEKAVTPPDEPKNRKEGKA